MPCSWKKFQLVFIQQRGMRRAYENDMQGVRIASLETR